MKTNKDRLVEFYLQGPIHAPTMISSYQFTPEGQNVLLPSVGGIVLNYAIGDNCMELMGDHVEPGVSLKISDSSENDALMIFSCVGNEAEVVSGEAKGAKGYVTGTHGGIDHTICYFSREDLEKMNIGDSIKIRAFGQGLRLTDHPEVHVMNLDPDLLDKLGIEEKEGRLQVPVKAIVPAKLMGSGIGASSAYTGDYDIMTGDSQLLKELGLDKLCFGDLVFLEDCDTRYGRQFLEGSGTLGIIVHSNCVKSGHGPGVTSLMSAKDGLLVPKLNNKANLKDYLDLK